MITFLQFQNRLERVQRGRDTVYFAPKDHLISLHGELFDGMVEARHDPNLLDIPKICQFVRKTDKKDWKLFKLVEV